MSSKAKPTKIKSVIVVILDDWGKAVAANWIAPAIKEKYPDAHVTLLTNTDFRQGSGTLQFDATIYVDDAGLRIFEAVRLALKLRTLSPDLAIVLTPSKWVAKVLGWAGVKKNLNLSDLKINSLNFIDEALDLLKAVDVNPAKLNFKLKVRTQVHEELLKKLAFDGLRSKAYIVIGLENTRSKKELQFNFKNKTWSYYSEFLRLLCEKTNLPILILGPAGPDVASALTAVHPSRIISWLGKLDLEESVAAISESFCFVGTESPLAQIAGSVGLPAVVLYGPAPSKASQPPGSGKNVICVDAQVPCSPCLKADGNYDWLCRDNVCMKSISPEEVWRFLNQVVQNWPELIH